MKNDCSRNAKQIGKRKNIRILNIKKLIRKTYLIELYRQSKEKSETDVSE